jgi:hypothetical protein
LTAIGAADLLRHLDPRLVDAGDRFEVRLGRDLRPSDLTVVDPGFAYLVRPKKGAAAEPPVRIARAGIASALPTENRMYAIVNRMRAYGGPNQLLSQFAAMKCGEWERKIWNCLQGSEAFVFHSPLVQLFDPQSARGYGLLKPLGTYRGDRTKDRWARPFEQWIRFRGYFEGAAGWFAQGDLRLYCPAPFDISHERLVKVAETFRQLQLGGTGAKMDCRAILAFTRILIESCRRKRRPREMVSGLWVTRYKDMGQVHTVIGMDHLALPNWMDLNTDQDAQRWLNMLDEHDIALRRLTDSHSEEFALLQQYRSTFQMDRQEAVAAFVEFLANYGAVVFRRRSQDQWTLPQLSLKSVTEILDSSPECRVALEGDGFAAVAGAIRSATFGAQGGRRRGDSHHREIRYGLLLDIRREGHVGKRELVSVVSQFVSSFNRESIRRRRMGVRGSEIRDAELAGFTRIVDRAPNADLVAALLCGVSSAHRGENGAAEKISDRVRTEFQSA